LDIPRCKSIFYNVRYSFEFDAPPKDLKDSTFKYVIGTTYQAHEIFLLEKEIRGPVWLKLINFKPVTKNQVGLTKYEIFLQNFDIDILKPTK